MTGLSQLGIQTEALSRCRDADHVIDVTVSALVCVNPGGCGIVTEFFARLTGFLNPALGDFFEFHG
jgi:hypothetical protein